MPARCACRRHARARDCLSASGRGCRPIRRVARSRTAPLAVSADYTFANGEPGDLNPKLLADRLAGVAIVAEADTPETTRLLSDRLARLGCYDGGVRVYWPGFRSSDDLRRHPLLLSSRIAIQGPERAAQTIERSIFAVAAFRFVPDPRIAAIIDASEAASRTERAHEAVEQGGSTWENYAIEMSERLDKALADVNALRAENENLRANQMLYSPFLMIRTSRTRTSTRHAKEDRPAFARRWTSRPRTVRACCS